VVQALAGEPGFIGFVGSFAGGRGTTLTAWTSPEAAESAIARNRPHQEAMGQMLGGDLGAAGFTSIWSPHRLNRQIAACASCGRKLFIEGGASTAKCDCGTEVSIGPYL
jgi:hypothetical protein